MIRDMRRQWSVCLDRAIEIDPTDPDFWNVKGLALKDLGKYDQAIECLDRAIEIDANDKTYVHNKGIVLENLGKYDDALKYFDKAIEIDPKYLSAWNYKGIVFETLKKYDEAIGYFDKAKRSTRNINTHGTTKVTSLALKKDTMKIPKYKYAWQKKGLALHLEKIQ